MFKTTRDYLTANASVWNGIPATVAAHALLVTRIGAIDTMVTEQEKVLSGIYANKRAKRTELEKKMLLVSGPAAAYAAATGNELMLADTDLNPSELSNATEQRIDDIATRLINAVNNEIGALADYGVTEVQMTALDTALEVYEGAKTSPDVARAQRAGFTAALEPLVKSATDLLNDQLDKLISIYKDSNVPFHAGYESARVIIDLRGPGGDDDEDEPEPEP